MKIPKTSECLNGELGRLLTLSGGREQRKTSGVVNSQGVHNDGKGVGKGAVSDPDEWDDWEGNGDPDAQSRWNGHLITPPIKIKGAAAKSLVLTLDSSWRPEDTQNGEILVSFDGGKEEQILFFKSVGIDAGAHTLVTIPTLKLKEEKNKRWGTDKRNVRNPY